MGQIEQVLAREMEQFVELGLVGFGLEGSAEIADGSNKSSMASGVLGWQPGRSRCDADDVFLVREMGSS